MFRIFKKRKDDSGKLADVQLRPVEKSGADPLAQRLERTRSGLGARLAAALAGKKLVDEDLLEELDTALITSDIGINSTNTIMDGLRAAVKSGAITGPSGMLPAVQAELYELIEDCAQFLLVDPSAKPFVILIVGVNGAGKTTTIGKLAQRFREEGLQVMLAAGDTFRAAAVEQLQAWGERNEVPVIAQQQGADSASVIFDALNSARSRNIDVLIADTAGRLHTQANLMEELKKIKRVMGKTDEAIPHEVMLVVDAGTGQNALNQAQEFNAAVGLTGITLTKLDGTARGGIIFAVAKQMNIPIRFIGVGEGIENLREFDAEEFVDALFEKEQ